MELGPVVEGDGSEVGLELPDDGKGSRGDAGSGPGGQLPDDREAGLSFNQGEDAVVEITANHRIGLPVTELLSGLDGGWPL